MRISKTVLLIGVLGLLLTAVGCSQKVVGTALPDAVQAPIALTADGFGIIAGFDDAPNEIEIFTEPQCTHCRDLQHDFGDQLAYYISIGSLQVTYRPVIFMDGNYGGYSAEVANALFLAAETADSTPATGTQFQRFVEELWVNQRTGGPAFTGNELRDMAIRAGLPDSIATNIAGRQQAVDVAEMEEFNFGLLFEIDPARTGTPTVFDLAAYEKLDIHDGDWLEDLVGS